MPRPPRPPGLTPQRWTVREYRELGKTGLFHDRKTMLIGGEVSQTVATTVADLLPRPTAEG